MEIPIPIEQLKNNLVKDELISEKDFDSLLAEANRKNQSILDVLISAGIVSKDYLSKMISSYLGIELADLANRKIDEEVVRSFPEDLARSHQLGVFNREENGTYDVAILDPSNLENIDFLKSYLKADVKPFLATEEDLNTIFLIYGGSRTSTLKSIIDSQIQEAMRTGAKSLEEAASALPIVTIVETIISYAVSMRASDIHIEFLENEILVRYRIDGILREILRMPKLIQNAIIARIKILAGLKIDEHYRPQDGRFHYQIAHKMLDIRVSIIPTFFGEKIEMRLLEAAQKPLSLEEIGMLPDTAKIVSDNLKKTYGMILTCGPTGSGKTTTLYALMNILNKPEVNIITVEDPIEYNMPFINQVQINEAAGITFAEGLRSILRQDPNIIMVGEIRDAETANIAVQASLTGHLLLSSLHTNDAPTAIPRLSDLKVEPFLIASVVNLVIAQRLVRKICKECITSHPITPAEEEAITDQFKELGLKDVHIPKTLYKGKGCQACDFTGYHDRLAIFETLEVDNQIREYIVNPHFSIDGLRTMAREKGMITMFEDGLRKVELGMTTLEEVLRVIKE